MRFLNTSMGGNHIVFDIGDQVTFENIFAPSMIHGQLKNTGESCILKNMREGGVYVIKDIIPANVHKVSDIWRYVIETEFKNNVVDVILPEVYFKVKR